MASARCRDSPACYIRGRLPDHAGKDIVLTDPQIRALPTSMVEVLPPPPLGSFLVVQRIVVAPREGNTDYGNFASPAVLFFGYGGINRSILMHGVGPAKDPNNILDYTGDRVWSFFPGSYHPYVDDGLIFPILTPAGEHLPLSVGMLNEPNGNLTGGDSQNTMAITIFYSVLRALLPAPMPTPTATATP